MFFATTAPASFRRQFNSPAGRSLERFLQETRLASQQKSCALEQDEKSYTLTFDVPGVAKDQLSIGIEGSIVRIESKEGAPRQYQQAYELPQDIDAAGSEAKLENGVLTLKLGKLVPISRATELTIN
ncbi:MAG: Hsp20/alpha crystallin family protein [Rhodoferax sp.]|uniref:Hsp20/alpha crystallin family protein n=1 Tax=Rhodoferax sp. TaxID=50421 RepID=UPI0026362C27|nr:Hsp20/alpha crystallin family protein [Rhodoferax sp.]MDD5334419.1 Hsp20/alpha crystallin family protein [Rhodoferax sp.]